MTPSLLSLNVGSSSIKCALFLVGEDNTIGERVVSGAFTNLRLDASILSLKINGQSTVESYHLTSDSTGMALRVKEALGIIFQKLDATMKALPLRAVGHRVVHGGTLYHQATRINAEVLANMIELCPLAPLHEPFNIAGIEGMMALMPAIAQVACFDTAFHHTQPRLARLFGLPRRYADRGIMRYGFHGLSYDYITQSLPTYLGAMPKRTVVAHLGSGASVCAILDGRCVNTSLGFSTIDGLMMSTRCGALDAGVLLHFLEQEKMGVADLKKMLYDESGLKGVSGFSAEMHALINALASGSPADKLEAIEEAIDLFCYRASREIAAMIPDLQGLDVLVFSGGIGENAPLVRSKIAKHLAYLGLTIDDKANDSVNNKAQKISDEDAKNPVQVWVIPTDEERVIAKQSLALICK